MLDHDKGSAAMEIITVTSVGEGGPDHIANGGRSIIPQITLCPGEAIYVSAPIRISTIV